MSDAAQALTDEECYRIALLDWLACAAGGADASAVRAARGAGDGLLERVLAAGAAGHVLDYDDTYAPGIAHLSAPVAPSALVLAADLKTDAAAVLDAYAAGFEAMGALARASHPQLYDRGWHPTAVCGSVGAAVAGARLLGLDQQQTDSARALALLRSAGLRAAFGSDGKALQVGMAAAAGVHAALLAKSGAAVPLERVVSATSGFEEVIEGRWATPERERPAVRENWIKPYPCCLATHSTIEAVAVAAADRPRAGTPSLAIVVHPRARQAAALDDVSDGLEAKFSLSYLAAYTLLRGAPTVASFDRVDAEARSFARDRVMLALDSSLGEWEARIALDGEPAVRVEHALGSPERPLDAERLRAKVLDLAGERLDGALDDLALPAADLLHAAGLE